MKYMLETLSKAKNLSESEALEFFHELIGAKTTASQIGASLMALHIKGETVDEMVGCVRAIREKMLRVRSVSPGIDVCGTGGDRSNTFNISTAVSFVVAGLGIPVVKHGNRAVSSLCGSADVLEELGITIQLTPIQAAHVLNTTGMVFLFAPIFHHSFKKVGLIRRELGFPTLFNLLGPFTNPSGVKRQLVGVVNDQIARKLALVGARLGYERLCIVANEEGIDEVSVGSINTIYQIEGKRIKKIKLNPQHLGFTKTTKEKLIGGDKKTNAQILLDTLQGVRGAYRDAVVLNAATALYVAGKITDFSQGIKLAEESIDSGKALRVLTLLRKETGRYA